MGPPGSGKGTLSSLCVKQPGWKQVSTGNLCRKHIQSNTDIGKTIKKIIDAGSLVSDEIIADMIQEWLSSHKDVLQNIILDGYPRTKRQAELLYDLLHNANQKLQLTLITFQVETDVLLQRILSRVICSNKECQLAYSLAQDGAKAVCNECNAPLLKRIDDTQDKLKNRIDLYYQNEKGIIDFFVDKGISVNVINGARSIHDVFTDFNKLIEQK